MWRSSSEAARPPTPLPLLVPPALQPRWEAPRAADSHPGGSLPVEPHPAADRCPCRLTGPELRGESSTSIRATLAAFAERDAAYVASALLAFRSRRRFSRAELAAWLGCPEADLDRLALRRRPAQVSEVAALAAYVGAREDRLSELLGYSAD